MYVGIKQATSKGYIECEIGGVADFLYATSKLRRGRVQGGGNISPTITAENTGVCRVTDKKFEEDHFKNMTKEELDKAWEEQEYRIRKLTPRECGKLMDVSEEDIDKILNTVSNTQAYRQFGNSIVCSVLCAVFSQLNIQGIKPWNERTEDEKYALTAHEIDRKKLQSQS